MHTCTYMHQIISTFTCTATRMQRPRYALLTVVEFTLSTCTCTHAKMLDIVTMSSINSEGGGAVGKTRKSGGYACTDALLEKKYSVRKTKKIMQYMETPATHTGNSRRDNQDVLLLRGLFSSLIPRLTHRYTAVAPKTKHSSCLHRAQFHNRAASSAEWAGVSDRKPPS